MTTYRTKFAPRGNFIAALTLGALGALAPSGASAHFILQQPENFAVQNTSGDPQKTVPCGQGDGNVTLSNKVTTYTQGQKITIGISETVTHPGHYRVSIANKMTDLPADPPVTVVGSDACGSTVITANPTLPLIADNLLPHTAAFNGPQTVQVQLPANFTCTNCTLQVVEYMAQHPNSAPNGCFYHHCATVTIVPASAPSDGGVADLSTTPAPADAAVAPPTTMSTGCSYSLGATAAPAALYLATPFALALFLRRRRRAASA